MRMRFIQPHRAWPANGPETVNALFRHYLRLRFDFQLFYD